MFPYLNYLGVSKLFRTEVKPMRWLFLALVAGIFIAAGCSGANGIPSTPGTETLKSGNSPEESHALWGLWQGIIDPSAETIELTPSRIADFHLNALPFLEPPPLLNLSLESLQFNGDIIEADIGLRHPFLGLTEFTGFDVCGVFITDGSMSGFTDADIALAGDGDTRLLNPDGLTRWWNPAEFPHGNTMFSYKNGLLGTPDSTADYSSTLNAYKYFCDDLQNPDDSLDKVTLKNRGMFSAGQKNIRHYTIEMGKDGLIFNYAVDASWQFPTGNKPWKAPDDFGPGANKPEAWRISVGEIENTLWNDSVNSGGDLKLNIDVYDWFNADMNSLRVESPDNFPMAESIIPVGGAEGYSTYEIDITGATPAENKIDLLISIISEEENFEGFIPGTNTTAYFTYSAIVAKEPPPQQAIPVEGNVWLEVLRNKSYGIAGLRVSWIDNGEPYFAVYADKNPYDASENWEYVTEVELTTAQIDITNMPDFSGSGSYLLTVRARTVSGSVPSESANSQPCFCEMEDFDAGDNPNEWTIGYKDETYKWKVVGAGQIDSSAALRIDPHPAGYWSVIISEPLPVIPESELSFIEFAHITSSYGIGSMYTAYSIGHSLTPAPPGTESTYYDFDGPVDFYAIMDGTFGWQPPGIGPPPDYVIGGGWIPLVEYFGWPPLPLPANFFGWRLTDGPHNAPQMSRVKHPWYIDYAPDVRAGMGYGTSIWDNYSDWGELDEIAVVIY